jgi:hypothetical protein
VSFRAVALNFRNPLVHKWNLAVQRDLGAATALEVAYVGNIQSRQVQNTDPNACYNDPSPNPLPCDQRRPYPNVSGVAATTSFGFGDYHGMTVKIEKRMTKGLMYMFSYTLGKANSTSGTTLSGSSGQGSKDPRNYSLGYSAAAWDIRHNLVGNFLYELPFGKGKQFGANWNRLTDGVLGGWQMNGLLTLRTGNPYTLGTNNCIGSFGNCTPDLASGDPNAAPSGGRSAAQYFNTAAVKAPAPGTPGNLALQTNYAPGYYGMDYSLFKQYAITERFKLQFRAEAFNITNRVQLGSPNRTQGDPNFGKIFSSQSGSERKMQFALRFMF